MSPRPLPPFPNEPLTPDERAWADRLRLVGPHAGPDGGPPPALDAQILAAAHAAHAGAARRPPRRAARLRWPTLVGAAASLVIVVSMAWQLRPLLRSTPSLDEGPVAAAPLPRSEGALSPDVLAAADPVARQAVASPPPPAGPAVAMPLRKPAAPPPPAAPVAPAPSTPTQPRNTFSDDAIPPYADYAGTAAGRQAASQAGSDAAGARAASGEQRERAAAKAPQPFPAASAEADNRAAMPAPAPPAAAPARTLERRDFAPVYDPPMAATGTMSPAPESSAKAAAEHESTTLDRIEVTGTRIRLDQVPVRDDVRLEPLLWLQRIRDRRDAGDLDGARESLALLRQHHPQVRLPDDVARLGR